MICPKTTAARNNMIAEGEDRGNLPWQLARLTYRHRHKEREVKKMKRKSICEKRKAISIRSYPVRSDSFEFPVEAIYSHGKHMDKVTMDTKRQLLGARPGSK
jgi:hypothetical protein